jgi:protein-tyrosine phosphatase
MIELPDENGMIDGFNVLDIRERMLDAPNHLSTYNRLINEAIGLLHCGKLVICCSAGVSRSNSIAIGVLIMRYGMRFEEALSLVKEKVPIANPLPCHLKQIQRLADRRR